MHGAIGICQDARKHKERVEGFCPRWFTLAAVCRTSTNILSHFVQVPLCRSQRSTLNNLANASKTPQLEEYPAAQAGQMSKRGPGKQRETEVNGGGVQRIGGGLEFKPERLIGVKRGGLPDEGLGEIGKDAPVAIFIGIGQSAAGGGLADAGVVEFRAEGRQAGFDVAQTFAPDQLGKRQHEELFISGEFADAAVAVVTGDTLVELVFGEEVEELGEDGATFVHKVENRRNAGSHPQGIVAELKSKNDRTAALSSFYNGEIVVTKN